MAVFAFYTFEIKRLAKQAELDFPDLQSKPQIEEQEELFRSVFPYDSNVDLWYTIRKKDGTYDNHVLERFHNEILANRDGIIVMTVEANKQKTTIEKKQKVKHTHNPYSTVIVDFREGQNLIALQKNSAFNKPEKFAEIILHTFNRLFEAYDLQMTMKPLAREGLTFWEAVNEIRDRHHDKVRRISLDFSNAQDAVDYSAGDAIAIISGMARKLHVNGLMVVEANEEEMEVDLDTVYEDMLALADICRAQPEYELNVHFASYGLYRFGADVIAQFGVDERIINDFIVGEEDVDLFGESHTLNRWLVNTKEMLEAQDYVESTFIEPAPKPGHRR